METNLKEVAKAMIAALLDAPSMGGVDSIDNLEPKITDTPTGETTTFNMTKEHFVGPVAKGRPGPRATGVMTYEVTVRAFYTPFDDDER